jgi:hypothetical protein
MHTHSTLDVDLSTLDVQHMDDDVMFYHAFMMVEVFLAIGAPL